MLAETSTAGTELGCIIMQYRSILTNRIIEVLACIRDVGIENTIEIETEDKIQRRVFSIFFIKTFIIDIEAKN